MKNRKKRTWLIEKRKAAGYKTLHEFSKVVGLSPSYYCEIEQGVKDPGGKAAYRISQTLGIDVSVFFADEVREKLTLEA